MFYFKREERLEDRRSGKDQKDTASEAFPISLISKKSACQGSIFFDARFPALTLS
jgi:hypothetical protein